MPCQFSSFCRRSMKLAMLFTILKRQWAPLTLKASHNDDPSESGSSNYIKITS